jgi:succinate dehydrogenase flavin-adding protein (antitoxin of CptAB toxin-antitoxin module)
LGIKTAGQLGGREELLDAYQLFLQTVIIPIQESMLKTFEKLIFLRDKQTINLQIEQNQILPTENQAIVDKIQGI